MVLQVEPDGRLGDTNFEAFGVRLARLFLEPLLESFQRLARGDILDDLKVM